MTSTSHLLRFPALMSIIDAVCDVWPEHVPYLEKRFLNPVDPTLQIANEISEISLQIAGDELLHFIASYRWVCEIFVDEDLYFRRTGKYRRSCFDEVYRDVYSNISYMNNYLRGLLLTQIFWQNQTTSFQFYVEKFLSSIRNSADYLEIGPGHGLLLNFAARSPRVRTIVGWDISESSLEMTRHSIEIMGVRHPITLTRHNILEAPSVRNAYDAIAISEVMEHLDKPVAALHTVFEALKSGGLSFFNIPINSPAPDHIFNWKSVQAVENMIRDHGFIIIKSFAAPATGYTLERAIRRKATINALIIAQRPLDRRPQM